MGSFYEQDGLQYSSFATAYWLPAKYLFRLKKFVKFQDAAKKRPLSLVSNEIPPIPIFVSHRWLTNTHPDPLGSQLHIIARFIIEAICLSRNICAQSSCYAQPEIVLNPALKHHLRAHRPTKYGYNEDPYWTDGISLERDLPEWLKYHFPLLQFNANEIKNIVEVMKDVGVWYDYISVPQKPFVLSPKQEQEHFDVAISNMENYLRFSHVLITWDLESSKRRWCLYEGIVAENEGNASYDALPNTKEKIAVFNFGNEYRRVRISEQIRLYLLNQKQMLTGKVFEELNEFLDKERIICAKAGEEKVVGRLIYDYLSSQ